MELSEKEKEFMVGLETLTRKTGIEIGGCGCCNSPFLAEAEITSEESGYSCQDSGDITWVDPSDKFDWEQYSKSIVKGE